MVFVYALYSMSKGIFYVGMSKDPAKRLKEHNSGKTPSTKAYVPWVFLYSEAHPNYEEARKREKYFKNSGGKRRLKRILENQGKLPS